MKKEQRLIGWQLGTLSLLLVVSLAGTTGQQSTRRLYAQDTTPDTSTSQLYLPFVAQAPGTGAPLTPSPPATTQQPITVTPSATPAQPTRTATVVTVTATPTNTSTVTPSTTATAITSLTPTATATATQTPSPTFVLTPTSTVTGSPTVTPTHTPTVTPTPTHTPTVTPTPTNTPPQAGEPAPCNQSAESLTLTLADLPTGWSLVEAGPQALGEEVVQLGAVDNYAARFINYLQLLTGTSGGVSVVIVFRDEAGAQGYLQLLQETFALDPSYEPITLATGGDESLAYRQVTEESGFAFTNYHIYLRQNNVASVVTTVAVSTAATTADAENFASQAVAKICTN